jgi:IS30 family transposase
MEWRYSFLCLWKMQRLLEWYHYNNEFVREIGGLLNLSHVTTSREIRENKTDHYVPTTYYLFPSQHNYKMRMSQRILHGSVESAETHQYAKKNHHYYAHQKP